MVWPILTRAGIALAKKYIAKKLVYETVDFFTGEDDYVKKNIYGVKPLEDKKALDMSNEQDIIDIYSDYLRSVPADLWTDIDYQGMRMSRGYDANTEKRHKVQEYLDYKQRMKKIENFCGR